MHTSTSRFVRSSFCGPGNCVEIARSRDGMVMVRDSKRPEQQALTFTPGEWDAFLAGAGAGEFAIAKLPMLTGS